MAKRTRKWVFVQQEARRLAELGLPSDDIAKKLGLGRATIYRWRAEGKLAPAERRPPSVPGPAVTGDESPEDWLLAMRTDYQLDATDAQIVQNAYETLKNARNPLLKANERASYQRLFLDHVRSLRHLRPRSVADPVTASPAAEDIPKSVPRELPKRTGSDPRALLMAVK